MAQAGDDLVTLPAPELKIRPAAAIAPASPVSSELAVRPGTSIARAPAVDREPIQPAASANAQTAPLSRAEREEHDQRTTSSAEPERPRAGGRAPGAGRTPGADSRYSAGYSADADADTVRGAVGPPATAAERFHDVLRRAPAPPAVPLPRRWQPLATAIVGERTRVMVRTDPASRGALRAAGKVAATRGNVIHLAAEPAETPQGAALLAHELTHVGHPSPEARFFDDDRPSAEERFAEEVAEVIRRSPVLPRATASRAGSARAPLSPPVPAIIRRSPAVQHRNEPHHDDEGHDAPTITAAALAARLTGSPGSASDGVIRRLGRGPTIGGHRLPPSATSPVHVPANASSVVPSAPQSEAPTVQNEGWSLLRETVDSSGVQNLVDWIVEQVETRLARDLERRGGRYRGDF